ncbi:MAG: hypothetical protein WB676_08755, partial [Bryobacteraceae bacterium]
NEGQHLLYAFGYKVKGEPRSIPIQAVTARLEKILAKFQKPQRDFCDFLLMKRNEECHTCETPFEAMRETNWLPQFYEVCQILNDHLDKSLESFFDQGESNTAAELIQAKNADRRRETAEKIRSHSAVFSSKDEETQNALRRDQEIAAKSLFGELAWVKCPACASSGRLSGRLERESDPMYRDGELVVEKTFLASTFVCGACGLQLHNIDEIHAAEIEPHFSIVEGTDLHEFYEPEDFMEYMNM